MHKPRSRHGFTLIEILVAISVITVLLSLAVYAIAKVFSEADSSRMQMALRQLQGAMTEYTVINNGTLPVENAASDSAENIIAEMLANGGEDCVKMINSIDDSMFDGTNVVDPWGRGVAYVGAGGSNSGNSISNQPARKLPYFASRGPDGDWGTFTDNNFDEPDAAAKDNLYSFGTGR